MCKAWSWNIKESKPEFVCPNEDVYQDDLGNNFCEEHKDFDYRDVLRVDQILTIIKNTINNSKIFDIIEPDEEEVVQDIDDFGLIVEEYNNILLKHNPCLIPISAYIRINNKLYSITKAFALVDPELREYLMKFKWHLSKGYARTCIGLDGTITMHRLIKGAEKGDGSTIDHVNRTKLDDRMINLQFATPSINNYNRDKLPGCSSSYYGVVFRAQKNRWEATILGIYLGLFRKEAAAATRYDICALLIMKDRALTNGFVTKLNGDEKLEDYLPKPKDRDLPTNIVRDRNLFRVKIVYKHREQCLYCKTLPEAESVLEDFHEQIRMWKLETKQAIEDLDVTRNEENIPFIEVYGQQILVDIGRWHELKQYTWCITPTKDIITSVNGKLVSMRRYLLGAKKGELTSHLNKDKSDHRMGNIATMTHSEISANHPKLQNTSSIYIGVSRRENGSYRASITKDLETYNAGTWKTEIEAGLSRDKKAFELYTNFENFNFPQFVDKLESHSVEALFMLATGTTISEMNNRGKKQQGTSSKFTGVSRKEGAIKWDVSVKVGEKRHFVGSYDHQEVGAIARDMAALKYNHNFVKLNFPLFREELKTEDLDTLLELIFPGQVFTKETIVPNDKMINLQQLVAERKREIKESGFIGVLIITVSGKFRAGVTIATKKHAAGCYNTLLEGALARDMKALEVDPKFNKKLNFPNLRKELMTVNLADLVELVQSQQSF